jgi:hypothetical protein
MMAMTDLDPGLALRQVLVELLGDGVDLRKARAGDVREVVVLVVEADVEGHGVERAVVGVRLGALHEGR